MDDGLKDLGQVGMVKRIEWIDALKGFGICCVIIGHMTMPKIVSRFVYSFHMPLFFAISGFLYKGNLSIRWVLKKVDSLLVMFYVWSLIGFGILYIIGRCEPVLGLKAVLSGNGLVVTWFLSCLFVVEIVGSCLLSIKPVWRSVHLSVAVIVGIATLGYCFPMLGLRSVFKSNTFFSALTFWLIGYRLKGHCTRFWELAVAFVFASLFWVQRVDMNSARFGNGVLFYGTALGFILLLFHFFAKFNVSFSPLMFIGQRSLEFMCLHGLISMSLHFLFSQFNVAIPVLVAKLMNIGLLVALTWVIHRYSRFLSGKAEVFQKFC